MEAFMEKHGTFIGSHLLVGYISKVTSEALPRGPKQVPFGDLSDRGKRKRTEELRSAVATDEMVYSARSGIFAEGSRLASKASLH